MWKGALSFFLKADTGRQEIISVMGFIMITSKLLKTNTTRAETGFFGVIRKGQTSAN